MLNALVGFFLVVKPSLSFILGLLWKIIVKISPTIFSDLGVILAFIFSHAQADIVVVVESQTVQSKITAIWADVKSHAVTIWTTFNAQEKIALIVSPFIILMLLIVVIHLHG